MPDGALPSPALSASRALSAAWLTRVVEWTLPIAFCLLFVAIRYQPKVTVAGATLALSDVAVLAVAASAALAGREAWRVLSASRVLWVTTGLLLVFVVAASLYPLAFDDESRWRTHLVTAAKYAEYALLAPAVGVLVRDARALARLLATAAFWSLLAGAVGLLQYVGVGIFDAWPQGWRQPSFVGVAELGALGAAALAIGFVGVLQPGSLDRRVRLAALVGGTLCVVLSGGVAAALAVVAVAAAAAVLARRPGAVDMRRLGLVAGITVVCGLGVLGLRNGDLTQYARYLGLAQADDSTNRDVQTFAQRELMYYIGLRVWLDKPVLGAGWQSIREQQVYERFLDDAHRRYPDQPEQAFPSEADPLRQYGIDNAYIQALAELGVVGLGLLLALLAAGVVVGVRRALRAPPVLALIALVGLLWLLVTMATWVAQGLVAGTSFAALSWLGLGLIAAGGSGERG